MSYPTTPSFRLDNKRSLVTGAGKGIGLGASIALAEAGSEVVMVSRTKKDLDSLQNYISEKGHKAYYKVLDVTNIKDIESFLNDESPFDILVNNAGSNEPSEFISFKSKSLDRIMSLNVKSVFQLTKIVVRKMLKNGLNGSIINVSSQLGHVGAQGRTIYCSSKFALEGLTKSLAIELAPKGIRVNSICPTFIETSLTKPFLKNKEFKKEVISKIPLGRLGQVEELMGSFVFLASEASSLITGTSLIIDGGWTAQ